MQNFILINKLQEYSKTRANKVAVTFLENCKDPKSFTYLELYNTARGIAEKLRLFNIPAQTPIALLLNNQHSQVLYFLAALICNLQPAILTPPNKKIKKDYYFANLYKNLQDCQFSVIISDFDFETSDLFHIKPESFEASGCLQAVFDNRFENSILQFSSGTTGYKSPVVISEDIYIKQLETYAAAIELTTSDIIVSWLPLSHDMGFIACLNMALYFSVETVFVDPIDWVTNPQIYIEAISKYKGTISWNPNFAYAYMAQSIELGKVKDCRLDSLRSLVNCAELVSIESQNKFYSVFSFLGLENKVFRAAYAMAEAVFALTDGPGDLVSNLNDVHYSSVGKALNGVEFRIVDDQLNLLTCRQIGEIQVRCPFMFKTYYNNLEKTKNSFDGDWYKTGDLGFFEEDNLFICGRKKDLIISAGINIFPNEIEEIVTESKEVIPGRVCAFGVFDTKLQTEKILVLFETKAPKEEQTKLLIEIRTKIQAVFQCPILEVHCCEPGYLIKSTSGKMARRANKEQWLVSNKLN